MSSGNYLYNAKATCNQSDETTNNEEICVSDNIITSPSTSNNNNNEETAVAYYQPANQQIVEVFSSDEDSSSSYDDEDENKQKWMAKKLPEIPQPNVNNQVTGSTRVNINNTNKNVIEGNLVINKHYYPPSCNTCNYFDRTDNLDRIDVVPAIEEIISDKDPETTVEAKSSDASSRPLCEQDKDTKWCTKGRLLTILGTVLTELAIIGLIVYFLIPRNSSNSTTTASTISPDHVLHITTEVFPDESTARYTAMPSGDYSDNAKGQKEETTENIIATNTSLKIITRAEWNAAPPLKPLTKLTVLPAARVIICETSTESCDETEKCMKIIQRIQRLYSNLYSCPDIAYNFLVGADGQIYEGRGWKIKGNVAHYFDNESISIAFIGNFSLIAPPEQQVQAVLDLIRVGVEDRNISKSFKLNGKRQLVYMNNNPGDKLYDIITKWKQWEPGTIGVDLHHKVSDGEYNQTLSYLTLFSGTKLKYVPKRGRN